MKKYELIRESKTYFSEREIFRIRALKDFGNVKTGDIGGWVCSYDNLSQEGNCWIYDDAKCLDDARMRDNARMCGNAIMCDSSVMRDNARMCDDSKMFGNAILDENKILYGSINKSYKKIFRK